MNRNSMVIIVIIDDNPEHAALMEKYLGLERPGDPVVHFGDGMQALEFLRACEGQPAVVLLDVHGRAYDGHGVLQSIKRHQRLCRVPVIVFTSREDRVEESRCYNAGCNLCLAKPLDGSAWAGVMHRIGAIISAMVIPT